MQARPSICADDDVIGWTWPDAAGNPDS